MPNNDYANEPNQSRSEEIIQSILDNTEYDEAARSRIEYLLIELKNAIEGGGGGGGVTSYSPLTEKPKIDNHTLQAGNNTSSDLGLQTKIDPEHKLSADNVDDTNSTNKFNVKSDWNAASGATSEILNKPTLGTASAKNVPASGDAATGEVVLGSDTRLTDARNAKDVYNWAKQENKPSYNYSEIQNPPTIPDELADLADDSTHRTVTDTEKDAWNGKQNALTFDDAPTSNSNNPVKSGGVYTALSGKQNNLSEAQMAAANSGATADKINKIAVNENNILSLTANGGGKNKLKITATSSSEMTINDDKSVSITVNASTQKQYNLTGWIPNNYVGMKISGMTVNSNASTGYFISVQYSNNGSSWANETDIATIGSATILNYPYINVGIVVRGGNNLDGVLFKPMISDNGEPYQPYALSNAAITPALKECVDNGAKNLLDFSGSTPIAPPNCTMTNNGDGTYTVTKTSENLDIPYIAAQLKAGTYIYSGCPAGGSDSTYRLDIRTSTGSVVGEGDYGSGVKVTIPSDGWYRITCRLNSTYTTTGLTIKPMLCDPALWAISPTFEPHAMSNAELTNNIMSVSSKLRYGQFRRDSTDGTSYTFSLQREDTSNRYHYGLMVIGNPSSLPSIYGIMVDVGTNPTVSLDKIGGVKEATLSASVAYDGLNVTLTITSTSTLYGGIRLIWLD